MRTGWSAANGKNALTHGPVLLKHAGVQMIAVHGRTREQGYKGLAEYRHRRRSSRAALHIPGGG